MRRRLRTETNGYVLVAVLSIMAILLTIVAALQYQSLTRKRAATLMEARYLASRGADALMSQTEANLEDNRSVGTVKWEFLEGTPLEAKTGLDTQSAPKLDSVYFDTAILPKSGRMVASKLFSDPGQLNIGSLDGVQDVRALEDRDRRTSPGTLRLEGSPTSDESTYQVFSKRRFQSIYSAGYPYAAMAPGAGQRVEIEHIGTWTLPSYLELDPDKDNPLEMHSGLSPKVGAHGDITVSSFPYGEAYSQSGRIQVTGGAISYNGHLPFQHWGKSKYVDLLQKSIDSVVRRLDSVATDKTGAIFGNFNFIEVRNFIFKGRVPRNIFTYQAASEWIFFLFPTVKNEGPTLRIGIHVPLPPDNVSVKGGEQKTEEITRLQRRNAQLVEELRPASSGPESGWDQNTPGLLPAAKSAEKVYRQLERERHDIQWRKNAEAAKSKPDKGRLDSFDRQLKAKDKQMGKQRTKLINLRDQVRARETEINANEAKMEQLSIELREDVSFWTSGDPQGPNLAKQKQLIDDGKMDKDGIPLYSYVKVIVDLASEFKDILKVVVDFPKIKISINLGFAKFSIWIPDLPRFPAWLKSIAPKVRDLLMSLFYERVALTFLEGETLPVTQDSIFESPTTFTVPRGRSMTIKKQGMTVKGDLWLQKGSSLVVPGNLTMIDPGRAGSNVFTQLLKPRGRIIMEEGSSLVVTGDLNALGDPVLGSLIACGPAGVNQALTANVIVYGDVRLPHGTGGGLPLEELVAWTLGESKRSYAKFFMEKGAPNLCKFPAVLGAFIPRNPFFGKHPVTLRVIPPKPIPFPTFETSKLNLNNRIFGHLSQVLTAHLNFALGENFMTSTSWWMFGKGQPAVFPKAVGHPIRNDLKKVGNAFQNASRFMDKIGNPASAFGNLFSEASGVLKQPSEFATKVLGPIATAAMNPDPSGASQGAIDRAYAKVFGPNSVRNIAERVASRLGVSTSPRNAFLESPFVLQEVSRAATVLTHSPGLDPPETDLREAANLLLAECPGVFVYSGGEMYVGEAGWSNDPAARAVGWFVAKRSLEMNVNYCIGSLLSMEGSIKARRLYFTPQFSKSSVYIPKALERAGSGVNANPDYWRNALNYKYGQDLDSATALDIPSSLPHFRAVEGWAR